MKISVITKLILFLLDMCGSFLTQPPEAKCKNVTKNVYKDLGYTLKAIDFDAGSTDKCGIKSDSMTVVSDNGGSSKTEFGLDDHGVHPMTFSVSDKSGNKDTCDAHLTIVVSFHFYLNKLTKLIIEF